jgi:hypothetical protein
MVPFSSDLVSLSRILSANPESLILVGVPYFFWLA